MARVITPENRRDAAALRIWQHCTPREWNCSVPEVAEALGLSVDTVRALCVARNWTDRMRRSRTDRSGPGRKTSISKADDDLVTILMGRAA